ncbi:MAG: hypothetical protein ACOVQX_02955 [Legionella sp.]
MYIDSTFRRSSILQACKQSRTFYDKNPEDAQNPEGCYNRYAASIHNALVERHCIPRRFLYYSSTSIFLKPYLLVDFIQEVGHISLLLNNIFWVMTSTMTSVIVLNMALILFPSLVEMTVALYSLTKACLTKIDALETGSNDLHQRAGDYLVDSVSRFVLIVPLMVISVVSIPIDLAVFSIRSVSTILSFLGIEFTTDHEHDSNIINNRMSR